MCTEHDRPHRYRLRSINQHRTLHLPSLWAVDDRRGRAGRLPATSIMAAHQRGIGRKRCVAAGRRASRMVIGRRHPGEFADPRAWPGATLSRLEAVQEAAVASLPVRRLAPLGSPPAPWRGLRSRRTQGPCLEICCLQVRASLQVRHRLTAFPSIPADTLHRQTLCRMVFSSSRLALAQYSAGLHSLKA